ncbi:hypothetical protein FACS189499_05080 [Clostridia bacterium]|nr:hypothetical protein FACS189499_05080 [Clostridia bacterium]
MSKVRLAVASTDGAEVNQHFGKATVFYIYDLSENGGHELVGFRDVEAACRNNGGFDRAHNTADFDKTIDILSDCDGILVQHIGAGALQYLTAKGKRVFEASGEIADVFAEIIRENIFFGDNHENK